MPTEGLGGAGGGGEGEGGGGEGTWMSANHAPQLTSCCLSRATQPEFLDHLQMRILGALKQGFSFIFRFLQPRFFGITLHFFLMSG